MIPSFAPQLFSIPHVSFRAPHNLPLLRHKRFSPPTFRLRAITCAQHLRRPLSVYHRTKLIEAFKLRPMKTPMTAHPPISDQMASVHASPPPGNAPFAEDGSVSGTGSSHSSALVSDVPDSSDPPSSSGKRQHHKDDIPTQPTKKARLSNEQREATIAAAVSVILDCLDDEPLRQGLRKTPARYAKVFSSLVTFCKTFALARHRTSPGIHPTSRNIFFCVVILAFPVLTASGICIPCSRLVSVALSFEGTPLLDTRVQEVR